MLMPTSTIDNDCETVRPQSPRIAVVGAGAAGAVCAARLFADGHDVTLFERDTRAGGHVHTHTVCDRPGHSLAIDTGFIVYNPECYPNFTRLIDELGVSTQATDMSLAVELSSGRAWSSRRPFAEPQLYFDLDHWRLLAGLPHLHRELARLSSVDAPPSDETVAEFATRRGLARAVIDRYLLPMGAAVWSCEPGEFAQFPAQFLAQFMANHGMLQLLRRPRWRSIVGGSATYMDRLLAPLRRHNVLRLAEPVQAIRRYADRVEVDTARARAVRFDQVVLACHTDQALELLVDANDVERAALAAVPYGDSEVVLHTDARAMPRSRRAWAAWNVLARPTVNSAVAVTYWMNPLQQLDRVGATRDYFVTLGSSDRVASNSVIARLRYTHPIFRASRTLAHQSLHRISGVERRTHFAGAAWGWGFHEDAVRSGLRVARALGAHVPVLEVAHAP
ncbi:MAG: NAD(P)/FAD-dependent oxidoreductase [Planctomycetota bacterium]